MNKALIEWFKISGNIKECEYLGRLLEPRVVQYDISNKIVDILQKYSIYYDYDEVSNAYVIYGYRQCSNTIEWTLDGEASFWGTQANYKIYDEENELFNECGEIEEAAFKYFMEE